jgi:hypothetical protein
MKKTLLITSLFFLITTIGKAQISHNVENTTFILPTNAVKITKESLATHSRVQQKFVNLPYIYKINEVYLGFTSLKATNKDRATLDLVKKNNDYDQANEFKSSDIYTSKIETINNNDVYSQYFFTENLGEYNDNIGEYFLMVYNYKIKKMFIVTVAFNEQSNYAAATKILYDFLNSVSFPLYVNTPQSATFKKNCSYPNGVGSTSEYTVEAGKFTSNISQADANAQALANANLFAKNYVDSFGTCTYKNTAISSVFTKTGCIAPATGTGVTYTVAEGAFTSTISPSDADSKARVAGQNFANANGSCIYQSQAINNVSIRKLNCSLRMVGSLVSYSALVGAFTSTISQADADAKARAAGQDYANRVGSCISGGAILTR